MTLQLFTNVITLTDAMQPIAKGMGAKKVLWLTVKARTNGFTMGNTNSSLDGFRIAAGGTIDIPISEVVGNSLFSLENLYWMNTVAGDNCIVEIIGMREV